MDGLGCGEEGSAIRRVISYYLAPIALVLALVLLTPAGDACEDPDSDTVFNAADNCPDVANVGQQNIVHAGTPAGDACEDPDGDAVYDAVDNCPD